MFVMCKELPENTANSREIPDESREISYIRHPYIKPLPRCAHSDLKPKYTPNHTQLRLARTYTAVPGAAEPAAAHQHILLNVCRPTAGAVSVAWLSDQLR
jgi:hypothetical protein